MPRFVILEHDYPELHFDLMLERGGVLLTWRLAEVPRVGGALVAVRLADHRVVYLDYEGAVGENRGTVRRVVGGEYEMLLDVEGRVCGRMTVGEECWLLCLKWEEGDWWMAEVAECSDAGAGEGAQRFGR